MKITRTEIAKLKLEKEDILVVRIKEERLGPKALDSIKKTFKEIAPNNKIVIIEGDIAIEKLTPYNQSIKNGKKKQEKTTTNQAPDGP